MMGSVDYFNKEIDGQVNIATSSANPDPPLSQSPMLHPF